MSFEFPPAGGPLRSADAARPRRLTTSRPCSVGIAFDHRFSAAQRFDLGAGAWLEWQQRWLVGDTSLFEILRAEGRWQEQSRWMYERRVSVPRLVGAPSASCSCAPLLRAMSEALSSRYGRALNSVSMAYYRDGRDSVAMHGDKLGPDIADGIVAIVSLGEPRRFLMKPLQASAVLDALPPRFRTGKGSLAFRPGWGDLLVMGGTCQKTWQHGVPKAANAGPRISVMFRRARAELEASAAKGVPPSHRF